MSFCRPCFSGLSFLGTTTFQLLRTGKCSSATGAELDADVVDGPFWAPNLLDVSCLVVAKHPDSKSTVVTIAIPYENFLTSAFPSQPKLKRSDTSRFILKYVAGPYMDVSWKTSF